MQPLHLLLALGLTLGLGQAHVLPEAMALADDFEDEGPILDASVEELIEKLLREYQIDGAYDEIDFNKRSQEDANVASLNEMAKAKRSGTGSLESLLQLEQELDANLEPFKQEMDSMPKKRSPFTVDFNGMQVSYPQYLRLVRLQEKVIKLDNMIKALRARYTEDQLASLPQYQRLVQLHQSLAPLLPTNPDISDKRAPFTVTFMGMQVSYPQYLRLVELQEKVVKLDKLLRKMKAMKPIEELEQMPQWNRLVTLHASLKKLLPADYLLETQGVEIEPTASKRSSVDFNGVQVSLPQYLRLMELQEKALKLDAVMRKLSEGIDADKLASNAKWGQLVSMRQTIQKLLPQGHPEFNPLTKRAATMEFNGVQVSYPQYVHLMNLQKKVMALDAALKKIAANSDPEKLQNLPTWHKLVSLRESLSRLMPAGSV